MRRALAALILLAAAACRTRDPRPSIVLVLVDTLRADHLGAFGFEGAISPNLDRLAQESVLFTSCFSQAPWTPPSVGTLFTSLYPQVHGLHRFEDHRFRDPESGGLRASVLPDAAVTLAELLRDAGYETAAFVANPWLAREFGLAQGFQLYDDQELGKRTPATMLTVPAGDWLAARSSAAPVFLYLHLMDVHEPYDSPREDFEALRPAIEDERTLERTQLPAAHMEVPAPWADDGLRATVAYWKARYAAGVRQLDRRMASFLDDLRESGLLDHAVLVVTADHGEELYEHAGWGHGESLHGHQLRVPLIVRPPGGLDAARRIDDPVRLIDLMPALLALAGIEPPPDLQGADFSAVLAGPGSAGDALPLFATAVVGEPDMFSLQSGRHKLIANLATGQGQLYDLVEDPGERTDLAAGEPAIVARLREQLGLHLIDVAGSGLQPKTDVLSPELQRQLEALGYLGGSTAPK